MFLSSPSTHCNSIPLGLLIHGLDLVLVGSKGREQIRRERYLARRRREEQW